MRVWPCVRLMSASPIDDVIAASHADAASVLVSFVSRIYVDQSSDRVRSNILLQAGDVQIVLVWPSSNVSKTPGYVFFCATSCVISVVWVEIQLNFVFKGRHLVEASHAVRSLFITSCGYRCDCSQPGQVKRLTCTCESDYICSSDVCVCGRVCV